MLLCINLANKIAQIHTLKFNVDSIKHAQVVMLAISLCNVYFSCMCTQRNPGMYIPIMIPCISYKYAHLFYVFCMYLQQLL